MNTALILPKMSAKLSANGDEGVRASSERFGLITQEYLF
jgi:hypothetical protein